ncbi:phage holin family protein [Erythrobacter sp. JK5]|uniref:phage holin family protein n=1 Tax=Erythrobacter sp. JK5 TaxID=2829500 RepID=UPI001BAA77F2|nr:phage holin family protein [Erythrobacter sp. JK5]QUL38790.1 phage holin family protein [Erythrobacter sp. JK5]
MLDDKGPAGPQGDPDAPLSPASPGLKPDPSVASEDDVSGDEGLFEELAALVDDGRTYAEAEIAFQKTRASLAGRSVGMAAVFAVLAIIALHIAFLALAVGLVIALAPLVSIWGAIAIVVGALLLLVALLARAAMRQGTRIGALFESPPKLEPTDGDT